MRRIIAAISVLALLLSSAAALDVNVGFENDYIIKGENAFNVFGSNDEGESQNMRFIAAKYENGELSGVEMSEPYTVLSNAPFDISGSFTVPSNADLTDFSVKLFVWDGTGKIEPLAQTSAPTKLCAEYELSEAATTSAGVYDEEGRLVRTLWSAKEETAGSHSAVWDGLDDDGRLMADGNYYINVMSNNVAWDMFTLVGNSSELVSKYNMLSEYRQISDMSLYKNRMYYSQQYMENSRTWNYFSIDNCHLQAGWFEQNKKNKVTIRNCTDGNYVYWLNNEYVPTNYLDEDAKDYAGKAYTNYRVFAAAYDPAQNQEVVFAGGKKINNYWGSAVGHQSAIAIRYTNASDTRETFGDIEVQKSGNCLFMITGYDDFVRVVDKTTGYVLNDAEFNAPQTMAVDKSDNVWISYKDAEENNKLGLFSVSSDGTLTLIKNAPESVLLDEIVALAVSEDNLSLVVAYENPTAKVVSYKISDWSENWSIGRGESYEQDPTVYDDKFMFYSPAGTGASGNELIAYSFLTFENSTTLWLGDVGNERCLKYDLSTGTPVLIDSIYQPTVEYNVAVDPNNPKRIFHGDMEYEIDYEKDSQSCWKLKKNWYHQLLGLTHQTMSYIDGLTTLENGRTFCAATTYRNGKYNIYEVLDKKFLNTEIDISGYEILNDGKMTLQKIADATVDGVSGKAYYQKYLEGVDENGYPVWGEDTQIAFVPSDNLYQKTNRFALSETGIIAEVGEANTHSKTDLRDMRMRGILAQSTADNDWIWKSCPATSDNYTGDFPSDGALEVNAWYTWHNVYAYGRNLIAQYRGEGYRQYQANKFYHLYDNGLVIGVFGEATGQQTALEDYCGELVNGNGFNWVFVKSPQKPEDEAFVIQGGEAGMSGALVWKITGLSSIKENKIPITLNGGMKSGLLLSLLDDDGNVIEKRYESGADISVSELGAAKSAELSGYIEKPKDCKEKVKLRFVTDGYAYLYIDDVLEAEGTGAINRVVYISDKVKNKIKIVIKENDGVFENFKLYYYSDDGNLTAYPFEALKSAPKTYEGKKTVRNLLEGLPYDEAISEEKAFGWDFSNWQSINTGSVTASTNVRSYDSSGDNDLHLSATIGRLMGTADTVWAERSLGSVRSDMSAWEIDADVMFAGIFNGYFSSPYASRSGERGRYLDVLDENDKVIVRIYPKEDYGLYANDELLYQASDFGSNGVGVSYKHEFTAQNNLKIYAKNGEITVAYLDGSKTVSVYESGARWNKPSKIRLTAFEHCYYSPHGEVYQTDFSKLMYTQYASEKMCKVTFYSDDKKTVLLETNVAQGSAASAPYAERSGFVLSWSESFGCVTEDMKIYAIYTPINEKHNVYFMDEDGVHLATKSGIYGETVDYNPPDKSGYVFIGWYTEKTGGTLADLTNRTEDITVYARYEAFAKAKYDFEAAAAALGKVNSKTGAITAGTYSGVEGESGFLNVEFYLTYGTNAYIVTDELSGSTVLRINQSARNNGDYVRFDFKPVSDNKKFKAGFAARGVSYNAAVGGVGEVFGTANGKSVRIVRATCDAASGIAVYDKTNEKWITLVPKTDTAWHNIEYGINLKTQTVEIYLDGVLKTTLPFLNEADAVNRIEFNMQSYSESGKTSRYHIDNVEIKGY